MVNDLTSVGAVGQTLNRTDGRRDSGLDDTTHANISSISGTSSSAVKSPVKTPKLMDTYVLNSAKQFFVMAETSNEKNEIICRLFHCRKLTKCVIYCKSLDIVENVTQVLLDKGVKVENLGWIQE
ncbi:unnamed protein product [Medioppia subpectinata]|uniref:Uncharacterized protein n=1 Tax=Medioppia subpectinata TaxID=1979941 RepID=A0A7R9KLD5_9ACAR|nr:unnamed protein product [Medioppia subpectinata]CAG2105394.1 unnamed protein product [Medioppia subpectinata]